MKPRPVKTELIRIRVDPVLHRELVSAANAAGLDLSNWLRTVALREVERLRAVQNRKTRLAKAVNR